MDKGNSIGVMAVFTKGNLNAILCKALEPTNDKMERSIEGSDLQIK